MKAIIIDDEPNAVELLSLRLTQKCPQIEILATFTNSIEALEALKNLKPDIVFLDIEMPRLNGFQVLEAIEKIDFALIFVTAYEKFALKAFRYSAIDYLLKPIDTKELMDAVAKVEKQDKTSIDQIDIFKQLYIANNNSLPEKIALPYQNGVTFIKLNEIIYCQSDNNYTKIILHDGQNFLLTKNLLYFQEILEERNFLRVHRQFIVNINSIKKYVKGLDNYIILNNDKNIPISRTYKDKFENSFRWM